MGTGPQEQDARSERPQDAEPTGETIPRSSDGVGLGAGKDANTFEPEEDPKAAAGEE